MSGDAELDAIIRKVKRIPTLVKEAAPDCAKAFGRAVNGELAQGHGPNGQAWPANKDGSAPLPNAAGAVETTASGTTLICRIKKPYTFHDKGNGHVPRRQILPTGMFPSGSLAIRTVLTQHFNRKVRA